MGSIGNKKSFLLHNIRVPYFKCMAMVGITKINLYLKQKILQHPWRNHLTLVVSRIYEHKRRGIISNASPKSFSVKERNCYQFYNICAVESFCFLFSKGPCQCAAKYFLTNISLLLLFFFFFKTRNFFFFN